MNDICDLIEIDVQFYTSHHADLCNFSDRDARNHYSQHGYWEGRRSNYNDIRENFLATVVGGDVLEIGPYYSPLPLGGRVSYLDVLDQEELITRARSEGVDTPQVPQIDYVSRDGSLKVVDRVFDVVVSSHNIEHQPDFITHLNEVSDILKSDGIYALIIPDARYCFDASLPLTKISEIFNANAERRRRHTLGSVIEHRALTSHNDPVCHWDGSHARRPVYHPINVSRVKAAIEEFERSEGKYIDVHAWQFDPVSFSGICKCLIALGKINFTEAVCFGPVKGRNEFTAFLRR